MKKRLTSLLATIFLTGSLMLMPSIALAENEDLDYTDNESFDVGTILTTSDQDQGYFTASTNEGTAGGDQDLTPPIIAFILDIINFITRIIGSIAMILIIVGGLMMIVSQGDENLLQKGKGVVTAAVIGLVITMFSFIIIKFFQSIFYLA
jgi:hypothetical protein